MKISLSHLSLYSVNSCSRTVGAAVGDTVGEEGLTTVGEERLTIQQLVRRSFLAEGRPTE